MTRHETLFLLTCALRVAEAFSHRSKIAGELSDWLERYPLGIEWSPDTGSYGAVQISRQDWMALRERLGRAVASSGRARPDAVARNCAELGRYLRLGPVEADILLLSARVGQGGPLASLVDALVDDARLPVDQAVARLTGHTASSVQRAMSPAGRLMTSGLIAREVGRHSHHGLAPSDRLSRALQPPTRGLRDILDALFASPVHPSATWEDFKHLGEGRDFAVRLLRGALRRRKAEGVNVLLYGPPGTGKTEFCRVIARHLGARLFAAGETDDDGDEPSRRERQMQLRLGQRLLAGRKGAHRNWEISQVNEMLTWMESHPQPFACTTNMADRLDPAALRRFTFRARFLPLTGAQRIAAFRRFFGVAPPHGLEAIDLVTPGDFAAVAKRAQLLGIRNPDELVAELEREQQAKPEARVPVGFRHG
jgi:transitional endoplasmic reticulum ATPase